MRVFSAEEDRVDREDGELLDERHTDAGSATTMKQAEERKEEDGQLNVETEEANVHVILDDLHALKGGVPAAKSDKHDELSMMDDLLKFRAEMTDGTVEPSATVHYAAAMEHDEGAAETADDVRAWKRARHDERDSPVSPSHHAAAAMATPWERDMEGDGADEAADVTEHEHESEFDHSQPSSPAALDESEHRLDHFAAVKLQSGGYNGRHEQQQQQLDEDGGDHADGMDDGETTLSSYPSKVRREPADEMAEHSLLTT